MVRIFVRVIPEQDAQRSTYEALLAFPPMSCSRSQRPARRRSMLRAPRLERT